MCTFLFNIVLDFLLNKQYVTVFNCDLCSLLLNGCLLVTLRSDKFLSVEVNIKITSFSGILHILSIINAALCILSCRKGSTKHFLSRSLSKGKVMKFILDLQDFVLRLQTHS